MRDIKALRVWWEYKDEELVILWVSPYTGETEKIATFWWPNYPTGCTKEVESLFESIAQKLVNIY